jgi:NAD(P)-dependent dehydrogenase (short-subunit alcohol dehydrogenase family)
MKAEMEAHSFTAYELKYRPFTGKVALVTGGASGMGRATAQMLAVGGAALALVDVDAEGVNSFADELASETRAGAFPFDLEQADAIPDLVAGVIAGFGRIDILVNAAGITGVSAGAGDLFSSSLGVWQSVMSVNVTAPFILCQEVGRHMASRPGGGHIVNISSSAAFRGKPSPTAYGCSKAALVQLTRSVAADLGPYNVNVNAVAPGVTRTAMMTKDGGDPEIFERAVKEGPYANFFGRVSEPEDVAAVITFLCTPASRQITGQTIHTSAGQVV